MTQTIVETMPAPAAKPGDNAVAVGLIDGQSFALAQRIATMLASSTLVPQQYKGNMGNCVIALNMAARIGADPLMVMQNLYVVHGTPSWSAQFLVACFNKCGRFSSLRYEFAGDEGTDDWRCRAWAIEIATGERINGTWVSIGLAKAEGWYSKNGSKWKTMPQQMLMYRAAAWLVRAYAPEIAMGLHTKDEVQDAADELAMGADGVYAPATSADLTAAALRASRVDSTPVTPPPGTWECPDTGTDVSIADCEKCNRRDGCPAFPEPETTTV